LGLLLEESDELQRVSDIPCVFIVQPTSVQQLSSLTRSSGGIIAQYFNDML
jgi:hypothetical protein